MEFTGLLWPKVKSMNYNYLNENSTCCWLYQNSLVFSNWLFIPNLYFIGTKEQKRPFPVYCDMKSGGMYNLHTIYVSTLAVDFIAFLSVKPLVYRINLKQFNNSWYSVLKKSAINISTLKIKLCSQLHSENERLSVCNCALKSPSGSKSEIPYVHFISNRWLDDLFLFEGTPATD